MDVCKWMCAHFNEIENILSAVDFRQQSGALEAFREDIKKIEKKPVAQHLISPTKAPKV